MLLPLHLSILNVLTKFNFLNLTCFRNDTIILTKKTAPLPFPPVQNPPLPIYTHKNLHPNDNLSTPHDTLSNNHVTSTTDTPIKIYSRINYPFPPPSS